MSTIKFIDDNPLFFSNKNSSNILFKKLDNNEDILKAYHLRYEVYNKEFEKNYYQADHRNAMIYDNQDKFSTCFGLFEDDKIIGSVRIQSGSIDSFSLSDIEDYKLDKLFQNFNYKKVGIISRLVIAKDYRKKRFCFLKIIKGLHHWISNSNHQICFVFALCVKELLPLFIKSGGIMYTQTPIISHFSGEERFPLVFLFNKANPECNTLLPYIFKQDTNTNVECIERVSR